MDSEKFLPTNETGGEEFSLKKQSVRCGLDHSAICVTPAVPPQNEL